MLRKTFTLWNCNREWKRWGIYFAQSGKGEGKRERRWKNWRQQKLCLCCVTLSLPHQKVAWVWQSWLQCQPATLSLQPLEENMQNRTRTYPATQDWGLGSNTSYIIYRNCNFIPYWCPTITKVWKEIFWGISRLHCSKASQHVVNNLNKNYYIFVG